MALAKIETRKSWSASQKEEVMEAVHPRFLEFCEHDFGHCNSSEFQREEKN